MFHKYDKVISLGSNCFIKKYLDCKKNPNETFFFDYLGISMWSINELLKYNFKDLLNIKDYELLQIFNKNSDSKIKESIINKKYFIRFPHDLQSNLNNFKEFKEKYERRIERLQNYFKNCKKILFIRLEENMTDRIIYPEYEEKYKITELEYINEFSNLIKKLYPNLEITIIYISKNDCELNNTNNNIIILKNIYDFDYSNCCDYLNKIIDFL